MPPPEACLFSTHSSLSDLFQTILLALLLLVVSLLSIWLQFLQPQLLQERQLRLVIMIRPFACTQFIQHFKGKALAAVFVPLGLQTPVGMVPRSQLSLVAVEN